MWYLRKRLCFELPLFFFYLVLQFAQKLHNLFQKLTMINVLFLISVTSFDSGFVGLGILAQILIVKRLGL